MPCFYQEKQKFVSKWNVLCKIFIINLDKFSLISQALSANVHYMGKLVWESNYGSMNQSSKEKKGPTSDTPYQIASISKVFTVIMYC